MSARRYARRSHALRRHSTLAFAAHRRGDDHGDTLRVVRIERRGRADSPIQLPSALANRTSAKITAVRAGFTACAARADAVVRPAGSCRARPFWQHGIVDRYCSHRGFLATCACATPSGSAIATVGYGNPAVSTVHLCDRDMPQQSCPGAMQPRPPPRLYVTASRSCTRWRLVIALHSPKGPCRQLQPGPLQPCVAATALAWVHRCTKPFVQMQCRPAESVAQEKCFGASTVRQCFGTSPLQCTGQAACINRDPWPCEAGTVLSMWLSRSAAV